MVNPNNYQRNTVKRPLWVRRLIKAERVAWRKSRDKALPRSAMYALIYDSVDYRFAARTALMYPKGVPVTYYD